jgi:hypothetical protein
MINTKRALFTVLAIFALTSITVTPAFSADKLTLADFSETSFSKTIDFLDYAREYSTENGKTAPNASSHAWLYLTYVNTKGMQMMYAGLQNITTDGTNSFTLPIQSWMMHYKSQNGSKDLVTAGSFIMLLAFAENSTTKYPDSPDKNDTLFASFNLGFDLTSKFGEETPPGLSTKTTIIPLASKNNDTEWTWGMHYTNMTAIWWETGMGPDHTSKKLIAVSRYDELTFTYNLVLNPSTGTATLTANYVIGKITDLWVIAGGWLGALLNLIAPGITVAHFNNTGCYWLNNPIPSLGNVHQYLSEKDIKMSIVKFQSTVVLNHTTISESDGSNVAGDEKLVSNSSITTTTNDNEKIFNADFATKQTYRLYNYTEDETETQFATYNTTTRTTKAANLANNPIFNVYTFLMRYIPIVLANMDPTLYQQAKEHLLNLDYADYFCIITYPTYSGYRVVHDPTYTAYYNANAQTPVNPPNWGGLIVLATIIAIVAGGAVVILKRRKPKQTANMQHQTTA